MKFFLANPVYLEEYGSG